MLITSIIRVEKTLILWQIENNRSFPLSLASFVAGIIKKQTPAKIIVIAERLSTNTSLPDKYKDMKEIEEKTNIVRKNFGKIALKSTLAFSVSNFVKIMAVLIPI